MGLACPYCQHGLALKEAKPGKYKPKCPKCERRFLLTVASDAAPRVDALAEHDNPAATLPGAAEATLPHAPESGVGGKPTARSSSSRSTEATAPLGPEATRPLDPQATISLESPESNRSSSSGADVDATTLPGSSSAGKRPASGTVTGDREPTEWDADATRPPPPSLVGVTAADATVAQRAAATRAEGQTSAEPSGGSSSASSAANSGLAPSTLGGYRLIRELGRGAMGAVYLAKQLSLNRQVALKLIQAQWASHPAFIARFMREAYAAAQLTHHNVVQIYDLGAERETNFFSMELVNGQTLAQVVAQRGPIEPRVAVGYILQAARGLQFAHNQGMVHRDVKPANLMLNDQGIVKVADLGLVKAPQLADDLETELTSGAAGGGTVSGSSSLSAAAASVTLANTAMGTPAYMAPEQADNASAVDHRADIYSLGCTLYVLLVGRPPFEGGTALEVITKHKSKPIEWPSSMAAKIPAGLSAVVMRMVAKQPEARYPSLAEAIADLENFLATSDPQAVQSKVQDAQVIAAAAQEFSAARGARLRRLAPWIWLGGTASLTLVAELFSLTGGALFAAMGLAAGLSSFAFRGLTSGSYLWDKSRAALATLRWSDWLTACGAGLLTLVMLALFGWLWAALAGIAVGVGFGVGFGVGWQLFVDRRLDQRRKASVERAEQTLKTWRIRGEDEAAVRNLVVQAGGTSDDEFFEALFGYEATVAERSRLAGSETARRWTRHAPWRDRIIQRLDRRITQARDARDRAQLQKLEEKSLQARGVKAEEARERAAAMAEAVVQAAAVDRAQIAPSAKPAAAPVDPRIAAAKKRERYKQMMVEARATPRRSGLSVLITGPIAFVFSGKLRFLAGCLVLAACALWAKQNGLDDAWRSQPLDAVKFLAASFGFGELPSTKPFALPLIGPWLSGALAACAGLVLVLTGLVRGAKMTLFAWPAAAVFLVGPSFGLSPLLCAAIGGGVAVAGLLLGRSR